MTVEAVMRMPFGRFMALTRFRFRQQIAASNAAARKKWEADNSQ